MTISTPGNTQSWEEETGASGPEDSSAPHWSRYVAFDDEDDGSEGSNPIDEESAVVPDLPEAVRTSRHFVTNPFLKTGAVVAAAGILVGTVLLLLVGDLLGRGSDRQVPLAQATSPFEDNPFLENEEPTADEQLAQMRAEKAIGEQAADIAAFADPVPPPTPVPTPAPTPAPARPVTRTIATHPTPTYRPPAPSSVPRPAAPSRPPVTAPGLPVSPTADPQATWQMAAKIGSYGSIRPLTRPNSAPVALEAIAAVNTSDLPQPLTREAARVPLPPSLARRLAEPAEPPAPARSFAIGTTAKAKLMTPLAWPEGNPAIAQQQLLQIQLEEDLETASKDAGIPAGTILTAQLVQTDAAGVVVLEPRSLLLDGRELTVPPGAILIQGKKGDLLQAKRDTSGTGRGLNIGSIALNGASAATGLLNPTSRSTTTFSVTESIDDPNIVGGAISGATGEAARQLQESAEERRRNARPLTTYELKRTTLQLYVNQNFSL